MRRSRRGDLAVRERVSVLLGNGEAAWSAPIRLELWNGVARELADRCRKVEKTAPAIDLLIAACARHHRVRLEHADAHFDFLLTL